MRTLFLDSSALTKRYLTEIGSGWVSNLTDPAGDNLLVVAEITRVEVAAALAARQRTGAITQTERDLLMALLLHHFDTEYRILAIAPVLTASAVELTQRHRLRSYDAVQLAAELVGAAVLPDLVFVTADDDLITAARLEGLATENPNVHL
jgi:predicted nucleic acid-binding protein